MNEEGLLIDQKSELKRKLQPLEWDKKRNNIPFAMGAKIEGFKKELEIVENKLAALKNGKVV